MFGDLCCPRQSPGFIAFTSNIGLSRDTFTHTEERLEFVLGFGTFDCIKLLTQTRYSRDGPVAHSNLHLTASILHSRAMTNDNFAQFSSTRRVQLVWTASPYDVVGEGSVAIHGGRICSEL